MIRLWLGAALLAASWLWGLGYYKPADGALWALAVVAGAGLMLGAVPRPAGRAAKGIALLLSLPAAWVAPWPYRAALALVALGLALCWARAPRRWPGALGAGALVAGVVLLAQGLALEGYAALTGRSHELPWPLPPLLAAVARLLGLEAAADGSTVALWSMRQTHSLAASWELLLDPVTLCFLVGGLALMAMRAGAAFAPGERLRPFLRGAGPFVAAILAWLPARAGLLMALYLHRVLRTEYEERMEVMNQFWNPWLLLLLLAVPVVLAWRFVPDWRPRIADCGLKSQTANRKSQVASATLAALAVALLTAAVFWDPVGTRKGGRVLVDEFHSTWEPTQRPYDTEWYGHDSGYNYACIYDYCSRFYELGRLTTAIGDEALAGCDVLMIKVPNSRGYAPDEVAALRRFVAAGGGLLLIGEHTDVFGTGRNINEVARAFGFAFRYDCLFGVFKPFDELFLQPLVPHPIVQHMPPFDFAVSCSIAPGLSPGRAVILGTGLKSLPSDYHASNFYPQVENRPDMRYGAFVQLWAARHGKGRVVGFTDSTVFSNFSAFEPGKAELMLGMLEWLNHRDPLGSPRWWLALLGLACGVGAIALARGWGGGWLVLLGAALGGWAIAVVGIRAANRVAMPPPKPVRPFTHVVIDRTVCDSKLSKSGFIGGSPEGFGLFERWVLRLGYFTSRRSGPDAFGGDALIFMHPRLGVPPGFAERLAAYVEGGGKVLVLDSPQNAKSSANSLLWPFELAVKRDAALPAGLLTAPEGWPAIPVDGACEVTGGRPLARLGDRPVAATTRYGRGSVVVLGFASRFNDHNMGVTGDIVPDANLRRVYDFQFALLRALVDDKLP